MAETVEKTVENEVQNDQQESCYLEKEKRIKKEVRRLKRILKKMDLSKEKMDAATSLIENAAFMTVTLNDLKEAINRKGVVERYQNGANQWGTKQSPEVQTYNTMLKNHVSVIRQLIDLLPEEKQKEAKDEFEEFVMNRD